MVVVLVKYTCKAGMRNAFLRAIRENDIDELSRNELANVRYEYSYSVDDEDVLILTELWRSEKALTEHAETEHYKELSELKQFYVEKTEVERFVTTD